MSCFPPHFICSFISRHSVPSLTLINCHSSLGLSGFSPLSAALSFDGYLASELWQAFPPPPSSLFFSPPTEVIIGMRDWRSQLIDNNVLLPDNRSCSICRKGLVFFGEPQARLECFYQWTGNGWPSFDRPGARGLRKVFFQICWAETLSTVLSVCPK